MRKGTNAGAIMTRLVLLLLLIPCAANAGEGMALPTGFDGIYASEGMTCGSGERITVESGTIIGAEWGMTVTDLIEFPGEPNKVEATLAVSGGGGEWEESAVIRLESGVDGPALVLDYPDGNRSIWKRCD